MKTKIFMALVAIVMLTASLASAASKAEIWQDPDTHYQYLVDPATKEKLSGSYDAIHQDVENPKLFVGLRAGTKELLDPYTGEPVKRFYHEVYKKDGLLIGELGACKYILNPATKKRMSSGYHEIYYKNDLLIGELGALKYVLNPTTKRRASNGYHEIYTDKNGQLTGELGATKEAIALKK